MDETQASSISVEDSTKEVANSSNELPDFFNPDTMKELLEYFLQLIRLNGRCSNSSDLASSYIKKCRDVCLTEEQAVTNLTEAALSSDHAEYEGTIKLLEKVTWHMTETEFLTIGDNRELVAGVMVIGEKVLNTALEDIKTSEEYHGVETSDEWKNVVKKIQKIHDSASQGLQDLSKSTLFG